jgi:DNA-binding response OmpR family regulator
VPERFYTTKTQSGHPCDAETKRKALENGADALLTKPIDFMTLRSEIDARVQRAA